MEDKSIIRTSDRGRFKRCRQLWDFESPMRQGYRYTPGIKALDFGIAIHEALEHYYDPDRATYAKTVKEELALRIFKASCANQRARILLAQPDLAVEIEQDFEEREELGIGMLQHYFMYWEFHGDGFTPVKSEIEFEVDIPGIDAVYQGRIDLIIENEEGYWIVDHKTAAQFTDTSYLDLDMQVSSYCWAIKKQLGIPIKGVIMNELRKSVPKEPAVNKDGTLSRNKSQSTSGIMFRWKLRQLGLSEDPYTEYINHLDAAKQYFRRTVLYRSDAELANVEELIRLEALDMLEPEVRIYPNPSRFNCNGCSFFAPCLAKMDGGDPDWILEKSGRYSKEKY